MRRLVALLAALTLSAILPASASAAVYDEAYNGDSHHCLDEATFANAASVCLGEHSTNGWPSGDLLIATNGSDAPSLASIEHSPAGRCDEGVLTNGWNDCVSDAYVVLPPNWCFRAYTDANYYGDRVYALTNRNSYTLGWHFPNSSPNNVISSFRLYSC